MLNRRSFLLGTVAVGSLPLAASSALAADSPFQVVATTGMIADAARRIGGDVVEVRPGVEGQEPVAGDEGVHLENELVVTKALRPDEVQ